MENKDFTRENFPEILEQFRKGNSISLHYCGDFLTDLQREIDSKHYAIALDIRILDGMMLLTPIDKYIKIFRKL